VCALVWPKRQQILISGSGLLLSSSKDRGAATAPRKLRRGWDIKKKAAKLGKQVPDAHPKDLQIREEQQKKF